MERYGTDKLKDSLVDEIVSNYRRYNRQPLTESQLRWLRTEEYGLDFLSTFALMDMDLFRIYLEKNYYLQNIIFNSINRYDNPLTDEVINEITYHVKKLGVDMVTWLNSNPNGSNLSDIESDFVLIRLCKFLIPCEYKLEFYVWCKDKEVKSVLSNYIKNTYNASVTEFVSLKYGNIASIRKSFVTKFKKYFSQRKALIEITPLGEVYDISSERSHELILVVNDDSISQIDYFTKIHEWYISHYGVDLIRCFRSDPDVDDYYEYIKWLSKSDYTKFYQVCSTTYAGISENIQNEAKKKYLLDDSNIPASFVDIALHYKQFQGPITVDGFHFFAHGRGGAYGNCYPFEGELIKDTKYTNRFHKIVRNYGKHAFENSRIRFNEDEDVVEINEYYLTTKTQFEQDLAQLEKNTVFNKTVVDRLIEYSNNVLNYKLNGSICDEKILLDFFNNNSSIPEGSYILAEINDDVDEYIQEIIDLYPLHLFKITKVKNSFEFESLYPEEVAIKSQIKDGARCKSILDSFYSSASNILHFDYYRPSKIDKFRYKATKKITLKDGNQEVEVYCCSFPTNLATFFNRRVSEFYIRVDNGDRIRSWEIKD